jgi:hypothetical protein
LLHQISAENPLFTEGHGFAPLSTMNFGAFKKISEKRISFQISRYILIWDKGIYRTGYSFRQGKCHAGPDVKIGDGSYTN